MFDTFTKIEIAGGERPIKCNIEVLAALQDRFGTLNNFEKAILGVEEILEKDGKPKKDDEGNILYSVGEPSLRAIIISLPLFLKAGYDDAIEQGEAKEQPDLKKSIKDMDFDYIKAAKLIHDEFQRCYERKNLKAPQRGKAKTP